MTRFTTSFATTVLLISGLLCGNNAAADQADIYKIEEAMSTMDIAALQAIRPDLQGYELALANYRLALSANLTGNDELAKDALDSSMEALESLDETTPENAEIKALLAQVYGYQIALSPIKAIYYGPKSQKKLAEAEALAPNNPRVLLVKGIGAANTSPMFGGDSDNAVEAFSKSIAAFKDDEYSSYHWGYAEAYTWRGLIMQQQGKIEEALSDWNNALNIDPNYGWAQSLIASNQP